MAQCDEYVSRYSVCKNCNNEVVDCGREKCPVYKAPTADVVPKSEYDRMEKLFKDMTQEAKGYLNRIYGIRADVAREIFEQIEKIIQDRKNKEIKRQGDNKMMSPFTYSFGALEIIEFQFAELKKKYTGG